MTLTTEKYTEGLCGDGAAILCDGVPMSVSEILATLNAAAGREAQPVGFRYRHKDTVSWLYNDWRRPDSVEADQCQIEWLYTAPPAPAVNMAPDFEVWFNSPEAGLRVVNFHIQHELQLKAWEACRAAMLQHVSQGYTLPEGWKLVPVEPTEEMLHAAYRESGVYSAKAYRAMLAAAPEGGNG